MDMSRNELVYQLLDPDARQVVDLAVAADSLTELREARAEYLANLQALREAGHEFEPDQTLLAQLDEGIAWFTEFISSSDEAAG
jgi:hypothetical protein